MIPTYTPPVQLDIGAEREREQRVALLTASAEQADAAGLGH